MKHAPILHPTHAAAFDPARPLAGIAPNEPLTRDVCAAIVDGAESPGYGTPEELTNAMLACFDGSVARSLTAGWQDARGREMPTDWLKGCAQAREARMRTERSAAA